MLRAESDDGRFAHHVREPTVVAGREAVVAADDDVVQLIERIAVGHPSLAFLVSVEQVAGAVEGERVGNADTGGDGGEVLRARAEALDGPAVRRDVVERDLFFGIAFCGASVRGEPRLVLGSEVLPLPEAVGVGIIRDEQAEVDVARGIQRQGGGIDAAAGAVGRGPIGHDDLLGVGAAVPVGVADQRHFAMGSDVEALGGPRHAHRDAKGGAVPEGFRGVFQTVAIGVAETPDAAVVAKGGQRSVRRETEVVLVR